MEEELEFYTDLALQETERWIQVVTKKRFKDPDDPRKSLEDGILLCELLNCLKTGCIRKINKLPTPIAGLDNLHVFLEKCKEAFNLNTSQLFSISDLEDLSNRAIAEFEDRLRQESERRLRNVAITIYWLGRSVAPWYDGPKLDLSSFTDLVSHPCFQRGSARSTPQRSRQSSISSVTQVPQQRSRQSSVSSVTPASQPHHSREESNDSLDHSSAYGSFRSEPKHSQSSETADEAPNTRDNSCDSVLSEDRSSCGQSLPDEKLGDYEPELDQVDMPGRYDQRTGPSPGNDVHYSATFDCMYDHRRTSPMGRTGQDHYRSSPSLDRPGSREEYDLFRFADDTDGYNRTTSNENLSGRTSGDFLPPTRVTSRRAAAPAANPLQFIKTDGSKLSVEAKEVMEVMEKQKEVKKVVQHEEEDWQSKLGDWKSRRKSAGTYIRVQELEDTTRKEEDEEKQRRKSKTYKEMMEQREKRKSVGILSAYPVDDGDDVFSKSYKPSNQAKAKEDEETRNSFGHTQSAATSAKTNSHEPRYGSSEKERKSASGDNDDDGNVASWARDDNLVNKDRKHQEPELHESPYKTNTSVQQRIAQNEQPSPYKTREKSGSPEKNTDIYNTSYSPRIYNRDSHSRSPDRPGFSAKRNLFEAKSTEESAKRDYSIPAYSAGKMNNGFDRHHREQRDRWRESELERQRESELERKRQLEEARNKEFEREKRRELERQQEIERRERELEKQRKRQEDFERQEELRRDRMEREAEREVEREKQRLATRSKWEADNRKKKKVPTATLR